MYRIHIYRKFYNRLVGRTPMPITTDIVLYMEFLEGIKARVVKLAVRHYRMFN